jgi:hypothetical protein
MVGTRRRNMGNNEYEKEGRRRIVWIGIRIRIRGNRRK